MRGGLRCATGGKAVARARHRRGGRGRPSILPGGDLMKTRRWILTAGLVGLASGLAGCGGSGATGTQVPVDMEKEQAQRQQISQFYGSDKKKKPGK